MVRKFLLFIFTFCDLFGNVSWVNYGWELFDYVTEARTASLGKATVAYNFDYPSSALSNPYFPTSSTHAHVSFYMFLHVSYVRTYVPIHFLESPYLSKVRQTEYFVRS